jgi:hypothetical protein
MTGEEPSHKETKEREAGRVADGVVVCAGQRANQEGSSPSGARMRGAISEGHEEKYRAVIEGETWQYQ